MFVCKCVLYCCHRVTTQLQLTNIYQILCSQRHYTKDILHTQDQCICVSQPVGSFLNDSTQYKLWKVHLKSVLQYLLFYRYSDWKQHHQVHIVSLPHSEIFSVLRLGVKLHSVRTQTLHIISQFWTYLPEFAAQHVRFTTGSPAIHNWYPTPQFGCADVFCLL
jgi:hypothetical protein